MFSHHFCHRKCPLAFGNSAHSSQCHASDTNKVTANLPYEEKLPPSVRWAPSTTSVERELSGASAGARWLEQMTTSTPHRVPLIKITHPAPPTLKHNKECTESRAMHMRRWVTIQRFSSRTTRQFRFKVFLLHWWGRVMIWLCHINSTYKNKLPVMKR